jgi:hypothetical protein
MLRSCPRGPSLPLETLDLHPRQEGRNGALCVAPQLKCATVVIASAGLAFMAVWSPASRLRWQGWVAHAPPCTPSSVQRPLRSAPNRAHAAGRTQIAVTVTFAAAPPTVTRSTAVGLRRTTRGEWLRWSPSRSAAEEV